MAVGPFQFYAEFLRSLGNKEVDLDSDTFIGVLIASTYTPSLSGHASITNISSHELSGGDYARVTLTSVTKTLTSTTMKWSSDTVNFGNPVTLSARYFAIFDDTHASDRLVGIMDLNVGGPEVASTTGPFSVSPDPTLGWLTFRPG